MDPPVATGSPKPWLGRKYAPVGYGFNIMAAYRFKPAVLSYAGNALGEAVIAPLSNDALTRSPSCCSEFEFEF